MSSKEESQLLNSLGKTQFAFGKKMHSRLLKQGCTSYVKTIYIGYDLEGVMVAALYPHVDRAEIALALPEDHESGLLIDATHLTWKTLPVAAVVKTKTDCDETLLLIDEACERIKSGAHDIERPNDYFMKARRDNDLGSHRPR
jgi:hypothetical protein